MLRKPAFSFFSILSDFIPFDFLIRLCNQRIILPFYHTVSDKDLPHIKHLYRIRSEKQFRQDLDFILKYYKPVDIFEIRKIIEKGKKEINKYFMLSFDDGLREVYDLIAPILKKKGIPATFFINSGFVDNNDLFYRYKASILIETFQCKPLSKESIEKVKKCLIKYKHWYKKICKSILSVDYNKSEVLDEIAGIFEVDFREYLKIEKPYLSSYQIKELLKDGFTIGAHSVDHPDFQNISLSEQINQTLKSINFLRHKFNIDYKFFSFPFTDYKISKEYFESIYYKEKPKVDISFGAAGLKKDSFKFHLQRIPMEETSLSAKNYLTSEYLYYLLKKPLGKNKIYRN